MKLSIYNLERGLFADYGGGYTAVAFYDSERWACGMYMLHYHHGEMPAFDAEQFYSIADLEIAMRKVQPDLRKWRLVAGD